MKNKLILILLCIFSITLPAVAQIKLGVEAGVNLSHYIGTDSYIATPIGGMKTGFQIGVTADYEMKNRWVLMSGLYFLQNRSTMSVADHMVFYFPKTDVRVNNLVLPVKMGYTIKINENLSLIPSIGPYVSYAFSAGECDMVIGYPTNDSFNPKQVKWKPMSGYSYIPDYPASIDKHKRWEIGATAGLKAVIYKKFTLSFNYNIGLNPVFVNELQNSNFQLSIGYQF